ncbi:hypothetical protein FRX31_009375 [Thalictrum thalictroides]|uniref:Uncharacterized protein n=1 Tax=Thalictrum thalictroides TaxID=46969 RepID=A0A7J6WVU9_THATH|nr:hypothetical protein FRX31_009375 [Thalictrum thalictroides]
MLIKIVHPGGHVELHDRPLLAAEIMLRNPRCCVAYPNVFKQPWAIVPPDTMLKLGQKFYVVPIGTIRKLQKLSIKHSPSLNSLPGDVGSPCEQGHGDQDEKEGTCCLFMNTNGKTTTCLACLLTRINSKEEEVSSECSTGNTSRSSDETKQLTKKRSRDSHVRKGAKGSPKRHSSFDSWQPSLSSIIEE